MGDVKVAVPDVNFKNEWYQNMCKLGGSGDIDHPAYTHKVLYDYKALINVFEKRTPIGYRQPNMISDSYFY